MQKKEIIFRSPISCKK